VHEAFRQMELEIAKTLQSVTRVLLEDTRLSALYYLLVTKNDHLQAERFINNACISINAVLNDYINVETRSHLELSPNNDLTKRPNATSSSLARSQTRRSSALPRKSKSRRESRIFQIHLAPTERCVHQPRPCLRCLPSCKWQISQ